MGNPWHKTLKFGKHNGRTYEWVAVCEPNYFSWLMRLCNNRSVTKWRRTMLERLDTDSSSDGAAS